MIHLQNKEQALLLTQEEVQAIVERELEARSFLYDKNKGLWPTYYLNHELRGGIIASVWSVAFVTPARTIPFRGKIVEVAEKTYFALVNDVSGEFLYIHHATGYIE